MIKLKNFDSKFDGEVFGSFLVLVAKSTCLAATETLDLRLTVSRIFLVFNNEIDEITKFLPYDYF